VAITRGVAVTWGLSPGGTPPDLGVAVGDGLSSGVGDGFGTLRFGGVDFGTLGDPPGAVTVGDGFGPDGVDGFPPVPVGEAPGVPEGFTPSRFGGIGFGPVADAFGEPPGVTLAAGDFPAGPVGGFNKLGGVCFCPAIGVGEPPAPGVAA
jgi:hypothetical protein